MPFEAKRSWYATCKKCKTNWRGHLPTTGFKTESAYRKYEDGTPESFTGNGGTCEACIEQGIKPPGSMLTTWSKGTPKGVIRDVKPVKKDADAPGGGAERIKQQDAKPSNLSPKPAAAPPCCVNLTLNFFFDGTGNNMKSDEGTQETSNITRLYLAHLDDDSASSTYRYYIPGIGTLFPEIGDPGVNKTGNDTMAWTAKITSGIGGMGQSRLDFSEQKIDERVAAIPPDKLKSVRIAVFGFSRGAALARAFAAQLHKKRCQQVGANWKFKTKAGQLVDFEIYFMGLFDCVASAGLPASARKYASDVVRYGAPVMPLLGPLGPLVPIAAKKAAQASGHDGWAKDLVVPPTVKSCVHYYSVHEVRNAFPLDSLRIGGSLPGGAQLEEKAYYGVHSNVGGGYRPGENGRSANVNMQLSNIPLNWMYEKAKMQNVALAGYKEMLPPVRKTFEVASVLQQGFDGYHKQTSSAELAPHEMMLHHMRPYIRWRSYRFKRGIAQFNVDASAKVEEQARKEHAEYDAKIAAIDQKIAANVAQTQRMRMVSSSEAFQRLSALAQERKKLEDSRLEWTNKIATLPSHDMPKKDESKSAALDTAGPARSSKYWTMWNKKQDELKAQVDLLKLNKKDGMPLLKYHEMIIEAWDQSLDFVKDEALYSFFDNYVHDSASDFHADRSLLIDPRMVFIGGDNTALDAELEALTKKRGDWEVQKKEKARQDVFRNQVNDPANRKEVQEIMKEAQRRFGNSQEVTPEWGD